MSELIIRPVQRLPSTALILTNLAKHTGKGNPDSEWIAKGLEALNQCIQKLNEGKAKNEARVAIFESYSEVDGCPVSLCQCIFIQLRRSAIFIRIFIILGENDLKPPIPSRKD